MSIVNKKAAEFAALLVGTRPELLWVLPTFTFWGGDCGKPTAGTSCQFRSGPNSNIIIKYQLRQIFNIKKTAEAENMAARLPSTPKQLKVGEPPRQTK
jgi:hypothetical protein